MDPNELQRLATAWVKYQVSESEDQWWAVEKVCELTDGDLDTSWEVVGALCDAASIPETLCDIGAGPLENVIQLYGIEVLERLNSVGSEKLLDAACCVWLSDVQLAQKLDSLLRARGRQRR
jgi:hypothetical protein